MEKLTTPNSQMKGRWFYKGLGKVAYGHPESYSRAAAFFDEVGGTVEDWGCGCAVFRDYLKRCSYFGIEGSENPFADRCDVDLETYRSDVDCILLRHVLDHNENWLRILQNAIASFRKRMVIVFFHDFGPETRILFRHGSPKFPGVPDLQFKKEDFTLRCPGLIIREEWIPADHNSPNNETMFYLQKP